MAIETAAGGIGFAFQHATLEGKITISVLAVFSLISWTVIVNKFRQLRKAKKQTERFLAAYAQGASPLELFERKLTFAGSPMFDVYEEACEELKRQMAKYGGKVPFHGLSAVRIAIERGMGEAAVSLESGMIILGTAISGGPFVGLLGTVWGVMDTFSGIARVQQASLTAMAPGVAAALIATVAGLMVAIPSLFCYNYLVTRTRAITLEMDNFAAHLDTIFATEYLREKQNGDLTGSIEAHLPSTGQDQTYPLTGSAHHGVV
jgi:biopolymer transport protein ExbB/TolQ